MRTYYPAGMLVLALVLAGPLAASAGPVNKTLLGVAVKGTDVVSYFVDGRAEKGLSDFEYEWRDATWRFTSQSHREAFIADPEKYAPQYGGYCAWAMSQNKKATIDPDAWKLIDGKLYLNYSSEIQTKWEQDIPGFIVKADAHWKQLAAEK